MNFFNLPQSALAQMQYQICWVFREMILYQMRQLKGSESSEYLARLVRAKDAVDALMTHF